MRYTEKLNRQKIALWAAIMASLNPVEIVTPTNANAEKEKWLEGDDFAGRNFEYDSYKLRLTASMQDDLKRAEATFASSVIPESEADEFVKSVLMNRVCSAIDCTEIAAGILLGNDSRTAAVAKKIYGLPSLVDIVDAYEAAKTPTAETRGLFDEKRIAELKSKEFDAEQIRYWFAEALKLLKIDSWPIIVSNDYTSIDVRDKSTAGSVIGIPKDRCVDGLRLVKLIYHEIVCHLGSSENTRAAFRNILGDDTMLTPLLPILAKSDDESLYEGTAMMAETTIVGNSAAPLPWATIAIDLATKGKSFSEIAEEIYNLRLARGDKPTAARKGAWMTTYRTKGRGSTRPEGEYVFPKDYAYRSGYKHVQSEDKRLQKFSSLSFEESAALCMLYGGAPAYSAECVLDIIANRIIVEAS